MKELMAKSFCARLKCSANDRESFIALSQGSLAGQSGWLETNNLQEQAVELKFQFLQQVEDRYHYAITGAEGAGYYVNAALGLSANGYLGMYHLASITNVWKFDFTEGQRTGFWLRDKDGYRVAVDNNPQESFAYHPDKIGVPRLNAGKGGLARFELFAVRTLP